MSRSVGTLPAGSRVTDYISLGVREDVSAGYGAVCPTGDWAVEPAPARASCACGGDVIALALYMHRPTARFCAACQWLAGPSQALEVAGGDLAGAHASWLRCGVCMARRLRRPRGAWYGRWRLVSLDGSTLDVADEASRRGVRPARRSRGRAPSRSSWLVENGTHVLFATMAGYGTSEITLPAVLGRLEAGMLCLADRQFFGFALWSLARGSGADLLWRVMRLVPDRRLPDGSYLSTIYPSERDRRQRSGGLAVRARRSEPSVQGVIGGDSTNSRPICGAPGWSCAARRRQEFAS